MDAVFQPFRLRNFAIKNRIVFPPVVCFHYSGDDGLVTDRNTAHYQEIAEGGSGIVITEATAIWKNGRLAPFQLGIWSDEHISGMSRIAEIVNRSGALSLLQIHHAGLVTPESVHPEAKAPSADEKNPRSVALTTGEIEELSDAFIKGAYRAKQAGFKGIELHGAHGYLLNQFASSYFNKRRDEYGGDLDNNLRFARGIINGIRNVCGNDFIIGYRMGANAPDLESGVEIARKLESYGVDILHVSHGGSLLNLPRTPKDFDYNWIVYSGSVVKRSVNIPIIAVNEIRTKERANWLLEKEMADFIALGRPQLADPRWVQTTLSNGVPDPCLSCKPKCKWYEDSSLCPARRRRANVEP